MLPPDAFFAQWQHYLYLMVVQLKFSRIYPAGKAVFQQRYRHAIDLFCANFRTLEREAQHRIANHRYGKPKVCSHAHGRVNAVTRHCANHRDIANLRAL